MASPVPLHVSILEKQKDFLSRMHPFYQQHLKGEPAPDWMDVGVSFLKKAR